MAGNVSCILSVQVTEIFIEKVRNVTSIGENPRDVVFLAPNEEGLVKAPIGLLFCFVGLHFDPQDGPIRELFALWICL